MHIDLPVETQQGMDLRDYFAAKAMPFLAKELRNTWFLDQSFDEYSDIEMDVIATKCYEMANAMMKARESK